MTKFKLFDYNRVNYFFSFLKPQMNILSCKLTSIVIP